LEWLAFPSDRIYLGPLYFLPLLQNCTSECADGYGRARFPDRLPWCRTARSSMEFLTRERSNRIVLC
jgi:hypothetical protein